MPNQDQASLINELLRLVEEGKEVDPRANLTRAAMWIPKRGWYYLREEMDAQSGQSVAKAVLGQISHTGSSRITRCKGIHFKFGPKQPGLEYAIHQLDGELFGRAVTNPSSLIKIQSPSMMSSDVMQLPDIVLATQTVHGMTLEQYINSKEKVYFSAETFSQLCVLQMLTSPGDGKLDNFIVTPQRKLIAIDNEMSFEPAIIKRVDGQHVPYVTTAVWLLPQMEEVLAESVYVRLQKLEPLDFVLKWLTQLQEQNARYETLVKEQWLSEIELRQKGLPFSFYQNEVTILYQKLLRLQQVVQQTPQDQLTHWMLFEALLPEICRYYRAFKQVTSELPLATQVQWLMRNKRGDKEAYTFESLKLLVPSANEVIEEIEWKKATMMQNVGNRNAPLLTLTSNKSQLLQFIAGQPISPAAVNALLFRARDVTHFTFQHCSLIDDAFLEKLAELPTLSHLDLWDTAVTLRGLRIVAVKHKLQLCLGYHASLSINDWKELLEQPLFTTLSVRLNTKRELLIKPQTDQAFNFLYEITQNLGQALSDQEKTFLLQLELIGLQQRWVDCAFNKLLSRYYESVGYQKLNDPWICHTLCYLAKTLIHHNAKPNEYLAYYQRLSKAHRILWYSYLQQEINSSEIWLPIQELLGHYPDVDGERREDARKAQAFQEQLRRLTVAKPELISDTNPLIIKVQSPLIGEVYLPSGLVAQLIEKHWLIISKEAHDLAHGAFSFDKKKSLNNLAINNTVLSLFSNNSNVHLLLNPSNADGAMHGNHLVVPLKYQEEAVHLKVLPDFPGMEMAFTTLMRRLFGEGSPQIDLWQWTCGSHRYPVLVSPTIAGENLTDELLQTPLELVSYSQLVLMSLLVNPGDGNPGNFIAQRVGQSAPGSRLRLISIDNDRLFAPPFEAGRLRVATILYCFEEMHQPLHSAVRKTFLQLDAYALLAAWLKDLGQLTAQYQMVFQEYLDWYLKEGRYNQQSYLLAMLKPNTVTDLFNKIHVLQDWLIKQPTLTHLELLAKINPSLANHYSQVLKENLSPITRFEQAVASEYNRVQVNGTKRYTSSMHMQHYLQLQQGRHMGIKTVADQWQQDFQQAKEELENVSLSEAMITKAKAEWLRGNPKGLENLPKAYGQEEVLARIDWDAEIVTASGAADIRRQQTLLEQLITLSTLKPLARLIIINCQGLTDALWHRLVIRLPQLQMIKLIRCPELRQPLSRLKLEQFSQLSSIQLDHCISIKELTIKSNSLEYAFIRQAARLTELVIEAPALKSINLAGAKQLTQLNVVSEALKEMDLTDCSQLTPEIMRKLTERCPFLEQLNLSGWDEKKWPYLSLMERVPALAEVISAKPQELRIIGGLLQAILQNTLKTLEPEPNPILLQAFKAICQAFLHNHSITTIQCMFVPLTDAQIALLAKVIETNQSIQKIILEGSQYGDLGAIALAKALEKNNTVNSVNIMLNNINTDGACALAGMLCRNTAITDFSIIEFGLDDKAISAFSRALIISRTITDFGISCGGAGSQSLLELLQAIKQNTTLTSLVLAKFPLTDPKLMEELAKVLSSNKEIASITFKFGKVNQAGLIAFANAFQSEEELSINFEGVEITSKGAIQLVSLAKAYPQLEITLSVYKDLSQEIKNELGQCKNIDFIEQKLDISDKYMAKLCSSNIGPSLTMGVINFGISIIRRRNTLLPSYVYKKEFNRSLINRHSFDSVQTERDQLQDYLPHNPTYRASLLQKLVHWENQKISATKPGLNLVQTLQDYGLCCHIPAKEQVNLLSAVADQLMRWGYSSSEETIRQRLIDYWIDMQSQTSTSALEGNRSLLQALTQTDMTSQRLIIEGLAHTFELNIIFFHSEDSSPWAFSVSQSAIILTLGYQADSLQAGHGNYYSLVIDPEVQAKYSLSNLLRQLDNNNDKNLQFNYTL